LEKNVLGILRVGIVSICTLSNLGMTLISVRLRPRTADNSLVCFFMGECQLDLLAIVLIHVDWVVMRRWCQRHRVDGDGLHRLGSRILGVLGPSRRSGLRCRLLRNRGFRGRGLRCGKLLLRLRNLGSRLLSGSFWGRGQRRRNLRLGRGSLRRRLLSSGLRGGFWGRSQRRRNLRLRLRNLGSRLLSGSFWGRGQRRRNLRLRRGSLRRRLLSSVLSGLRGSFWGRGQRRRNLRLRHGSFLSGLRGSFRGVRRRLLMRRT
jgi:hypothetical protein